RAPGHACGEQQRQRGAHGTGLAAQLKPADSAIDRPPGRNAMPVFDNILQAIGRTPLVRLHKLVGPKDAAVYAKCEFMNPGGAVKDRMALYILDKAEREGRLKPGTTIV